MIRGLLQMVFKPGGLAETLSQTDAARIRDYATHQRYYEGRHFIRDRPGRSNLVVNYCRAMVDKGVSYLLGRGLNFGVVPLDESDDRQRDLARRAEEILYTVYWDNDLDAVDIEVATNSLELGDGVYKVFYDPREQRIRVISVDPYSWFAESAADDLSVLRQAHLGYRLEPAGVLSMAPVIGLSAEQAVALGTGPQNVIESWTESEFAITIGNMEVRRAANPYGFIPFVHVPNLPRPQQLYGVSDLVDVTALNLELDERISDQSDIIKLHADPPVVFRGVDDHTDLAVGPGTVWDLPSDADVKYLEWQGQPVAVGEQIERLQRVMYEVSETPRTAFGDSGRLLSGVALETELRPLIQKTLRRRAYWNRGLRRRNAMILKLAEIYGVSGAEVGLFAPYRTRVIWPPMMPSDDTADVTNNINLVVAGLRAPTTAMDKLGEESPEEEIRRIQRDREVLGVVNAGGISVQPAVDPVQPPGRPEKGATP